VNCADHPYEAAVAVCVGCQRGLCAACAAEFGQPACANCVMAHNKGVIRGFTFKLAMMVVLCAASLGLAWTLLDAKYLALLGATSAFAPWGWEFMRRLGLARDVEYVSPVVQLSNILLQLLGAMVLGLVVGPYQLYKAVKEIRIARSTNQHLEARGGEAPV